MATMEGSLSKWTNVMKGWQYRWFVLDDNAGLLSYYTSREKMMRGVRRGCVRLRGAVIGIDDEDDSTFTITVDSKTFHFQARDGDEREKWVRCLEDTILRHVYGYKSESSHSLTIQDFDKKLAEADAYLQILIDQTKAIEARMLTLEAEEKQKCEIICNHANNMLEQMKHTIVLLQIAKNTAHPVNGTYQPLTLTDTSTNKPIDGLSLSVPIEPGVEVGSECQPPTGTKFIHTLTGHSPLALPVTVVPETSYSSSEEEDFYDAHDSSDPPSLSSPVSSTKLGVDVDEADRDTSDELNGQKSACIIPTYLRPDGSLDYDQLYEDCEETNISMESQGSVVTHLLSQVKIGMDLTKVVLPTFILERRSLLEMYADYFAHPDMFVRIADQATEQDRMVQVVKWYLCSYHAGRKSTVAKKPYNPILGEIFQCYWDLQRTDNEETEQSLVVDGPVPWCHGNQLTFIAEQVSHHPPISAFYAEHYNKRISFNAHVWTRSKFLGLSIGVHNIGSGIIDVIDHNEQYVVTFPNGYGRSILTVPWIELGGTVTINCKKTGYKAVLEFLTKPFYGGKKHRITGEVFSPNDKKPFLNIHGEWNGVMEAKWSDGKSEQFANINNLEIIRKNVRPIENQDENESRKLWREVTAGLRLNNVSHASNAKCALEQKQRMEAQQRKELGIPWETKLFQLDADDNWTYVKPLADRLSNTRVNR
uniref:Oxysterol-binding protein n=2 Tax=Triatoma infestans TaxID=30076 RepID=A0A023F2L0_TRIIF